MIPKADTQEQVSTRPTDKQFAAALESGAFKRAFPGMVHPVELGAPISNYRPRILKDDIAKLVAGGHEHGKNGRLDLQLLRLQELLRQAEWIYTNFNQRIKPELQELDPRQMDLIAALPQS